MPINLYSSGQYTELTDMICVRFCHELGMFTTVRASTASMTQYISFCHIKDLLYYFITSFYNISFIKYFIIQFYTLK